MLPFMLASVEVLLILAWPWPKHCLAFHLFHLLLPVTGARAFVRLMVDG